MQSEQCLQTVKSFNGRMSMGRPDKTTGEVIKVVLRSGNNRWNMWQGQFVTKTS